MIALGLWVVALCGLVGSLYGGAIILHERTQLESSFYTAFHRNTWSISLGLVVVLCVSGFGGKIHLTKIGGFLTITFYISFRSNRYIPFRLDFSVRHESILFDILDPHFYFNGKDRF